MKYCIKCGNPMQDDMLFCQKCGTKVLEVEEKEISGRPTFEKDNDSSSMHSSTDQLRPDNDKDSTNKMRTGMKVAMIVCFIFAAIYLVMGIAMSLSSIYIGMTGFFATLGIMFLVLGKSPKENPFILNMKAGLKKSTFVIICLVVAFGISGVAMSMDPSMSQETEQSTTEVTTDGQNAVESNEVNEEVSLSDVQKWYEDQTAAVSQSLIEYSKSIQGLSNLNVQSSKFLLGEDSGWYDCHYTFTFTCNYNGEKHNGEARAFMKYQDNSIHWFHYEIFDNSGIESPVEQYDDSYDQIIEDYYKELESTYK